jgi:hypothetical protein
MLENSMTQENEKIHHLTVESLILSANSRNNERNLQLADQIYPTSSLQDSLWLKLLRSSHSSKYESNRRKLELGEHHDHTLFLCLPLSKVGEGGGKEKRSRERRHHSLSLDWLPCACVSCKY